MEKFGVTKSRNRLLNDVAKRVNPNRVSVSITPRQKTVLEAVSQRPGRGKTPGGLAGALFEAAWPLFEKFDFDPYAIAQEVQRLTKGNEKEKAS